MDSRPREHLVAPAVRHRLLGGFLARMARHPDADGFVLRGGMLVRHLLPSSGRRALDVDLVCRLPYEPWAMRRRLEEILADHTVRDGVGFDPKSIHLDGVWRGSNTPALCLRALGAVGAELATLTVDLLFGLPLWPETEPTTSMTWGGGVLQVARPETLIGRKIEVVTQLGRSRWRAKDLADLHLLLGLDLDRSTLGEAIERAFDGSPVGIHQARSAFRRSSWWRHTTAAGRWSRFNSVAGHGRHADVQAAAAAVRSAVAPVFGEAH